MYKYYNISLIILVLIIFKLVVIMSQSALKAELMELYRLCNGRCYNFVMAYPDEAQAFWCKQRCRQMYLL